MTLRKRRSSPLGWASQPQALQTFSRPSFLARVHAAWRQGDANCTTVGVGEGGLHLGWGWFFTLAHTTRMVTPVSPPLHARTPPHPEEGCILYRASWSTRSVRRKFHRSRSLPRSLSNGISTPKLGNSVNGCGVLSVPGRALGTSGDQLGPALSVRRRLRVRIWGRSPKYTQQGSCAVCSAGRVSPHTAYPV